LVAPSNVEELKNAMIDLIQSAAKRSSFALASKRRIQNDFVIDVTAKKTIDTYQQILSQS
jgi:glycosyltransferase involved in cell wall biosynthesis